MVTCFVPWAREPSKRGDTDLKPPPSPASLAAREGIKADNKISKLINDAVCFLAEVITVKDNVITECNTASHLDRVAQGQAIRRWGTRWRTIVVFAMLTEVGESETDDGQSSTPLICLSIFGLTPFFRWP